MRFFRRLSAPICFLLIAPALVVESFITAATPLPGWLNTGIAIFLILAYGPPILLLRELWVRYRLSLPALYLLGMIYGFINEGLLAHTITMIDGEPITSFVGYGVLFGMNWTWTSLIVPWHAFYSVTFMVLLSRLLFPQQADQPWLSPRGLYITGGITALAVPFYFLFETEQRLSPLHAAPIYLLMMLGLFWLALRWPAAVSKPQHVTRRELITSMLAGLPTPAVFTILGFVLAKQQIPLLLYFGLTLGAVALVLYCLQRVREARVLAFMLGGTVGLAFFAAILSKNPAYFVATPAFVLTMVLVFRLQLMRADRDQTL